MRKRDGCGVGVRKARSPRNINCANGRVAVQINRQLSIVDNLAFAGFGKNTADVACGIKLSAFRRDRYRAVVGKSFG